MTTYEYIVSKRKTPEYQENTGNNENLSSFPEKRVQPTNATTDINNII